MGGKPAAKPKRKLVARRGTPNTRRAAAARVAARPKYEVAWQPQPGPQTALLTCPVHEVLYGGARGGGKTDGMIADFGIHAATYGAEARGVFFRREFRQLEDAIRRAKQLYMPMGVRWHTGNATLTWPNGATLRFRHLWDTTAAEKYQGHNYSWICFEELTNWPDPAAIDMLRATLRSATGVPTFFRATANPGGAGHNWVKARYIDPAPRGYVLLADEDTGENRVFIPARLEDNQMLMENDPAYERRLMRSGDSNLVRAWRLGDWNIVAGGFFDDCFAVDTHVLPHFDIPPTWRYRRSFDWGYSKPSSLGLWTIAADPIEVDGRFIPRGSMIRFAEWYGVEIDDRGAPRPNVGLRVNNTDLGVIIAEQSGGHAWRGCVADPSIFNAQGSQSIYNQIREGAKILGHNLNFAPADNSRVPGWQRVRSMLEAATLERPEDPCLYVTESCTEWIRTVPILQRSRKNPDDIDTEAEDHAGDDTRYLVMSEASTAARAGSRTFL